MDSKEMVEIVKNAIDDRKGKDIEVIDIQEKTIIADYFIVASGTSTTHLKGIADEVVEKMEAAGCKCVHMAGYESATWILLDFTDVVVHLFLQSEREYYNIEKLWKKSTKDKDNK